MEVIFGVIYITISNGIAIIKDLIGLNNLIDDKSFANYISFVIQKIVTKVMIGFVIKGLFYRTRDLELLY